MTKLGFLFLFVLLTACSQANYSKMTRRITQTYLKEFADPKQLVLYGYGGALMEDVKCIFLRFLSQDALDVDEARILYVEMLDEFLRRVNSDEMIRPYLHNYSFDIKNVELMISFDDSLGNIRSDGYVALMFLGKNDTLVFKAYHPNNGFYTLLREPYEEARKKALESTSMPNSEPLSISQ